MILVVSDKEKDTSSTSGMETSRLTSPLLQFRSASVVQPRLETIEAAYLAKDFETFGKITMQDSNQFHATCLDTYPPIFYMNDVSKAIIRLVHVVNAHFGSIKAAYTFDAGPNAVIYTLEKVGWVEREGVRGGGIHSLFSNYVYPWGGGLEGIHSLLCVPQLVCTMQNY